MDPNGHIYESEDVSAEDRARLEGYLKGRAEADMKDKLAEMQARVRELEAQRAD